MDLTLLDKILSGKDQEIKNMYSQQQAVLQEKQLLVQELSTRLDSVQKDLEYNLQLLSDRDRELLMLERSLEDERRHSQHKDNTINEMMTELSKTKQVLSETRHQMDTDKIKHEESVRQLERAMKDQDRQHHLNIQHQEEAFDRERNQLYLRIKSKEAEFNSLQDAFSAQMSESLQAHREQERRIESQYQQSILEAESSLKQVQSELQAVKIQKDKLKEELVVKSSRINTLEKQLRDLEFEFKDTNLMTAERIAELEKVIEECHRIADKDSRSYQKTLSDQQRDADIEIKRLHTNLDQMRHDKEEEHKKMELIKTNAKREIERLSKGLKDALEEKQVLQERLDQQSKRMAEQENELSETREQSTQMTGQFDTTKQQYEKQLASIKHSYQQELNRLSTQFKTLSVQSTTEKQLLLATSQQHKKELQTAQVALKDTQDALDRTKNDLERARADIKALNLKMAEYEQQITHLQQMRSYPADKDIIELENENEQLRQLVHQMRQDMEAVVSKPPTRQDTIDEAIRSNDALLKMQTLLNQKQKLIDQLMEQQLYPPEDHHKDIESYEEQIRHLTLEKRQLVELSNKLIAKTRNKENLKQNSTQSIIIHLS